MHPLGLRLDLAFSRPDAGKGQYVQDILNAHKGVVQRFLNGNGAIMVCGGLEMGREVEHALRNIVGHKWIDLALEAQHFRRDLY